MSIAIAICKSNDRSSSTVAEIELRRQALQVSRLALCLAANVGERTYRRLVTGAVVSQRGTVIRLRRALDQLSGAPKPAPAPSIVAAFWRSAVICLCHELKADVTLALDESRHSSPEDPEWVRAARARQCAFYLAHVEFSVGFADLAAAVGSSKQRVHKAVRRIEDLRDDPDLDALLERTAAAITGRAQV